MRGWTLRWSSGALVAIAIACSSRTENPPGTTAPDAAFDAGPDHSRADAIAEGGGAAGAAGSTGGIDGGDSSGTGGIAASGGSSGTGGGLNCSSSSSERCICSPTTFPSTAIPICNPASINGYCCADQSFPSYGLCSCRRWTCEESSAGCECGSSSTGSRSHCLQNWANCCMYTVGTASTCSCDDFGAPCEPGAVSVPTCAIDSVPCGPAERAIKTCDRIESGSGGSSGGSGVGGTGGTGGTSGTGGSGGTGGTGTDGGPTSCAGMNCGVDRGIVCGTCELGQYCATNNTCQATCSGKVCGEVNGGSCGTCPPDRVCSDNQQACLTKVCPPNQIDCDVNYRATCNARGTGFVARLDNCATAGLVCFHGGCGTHGIDYVARDIQADVGIVYGGTRVGNFYEVTTSRRLTEIAARTTQFRGDLYWIVLELGAAPVELLNLRGTWDPDADAYATSGPVSINLAAERRTSSVSKTTRGSSTKRRRSSAIHRT
jgi:hypothetical protein